MNVENESIMLPEWVNSCLAKNHIKKREQTTKEAFSFDYCNATFQDENYNKDNKTLKIEKVKVHDKKVIDKVETNVDILGIVASGLMRFHQVTSNVVVVSIEQQEVENVILKARMQELEML